MGHLDEKTIDLYVQNPALLDEGTRAKVEGHLQICPGCSTLAEFFRSYYRDLAEASKRTLPSTAHQEEVLERIVPRARVIRLFAYHPRQDVPPPDGHDLVVLAAQSQTKDAARFETVATLANDGERMLLRVVHDTATDGFRAYLHADDPSRVGSALVSFEGMSLNLVLNEKGQKEFTLPPADRPRDWSLVGTLVRPALGPVTIRSSDIEHTGSASASVPGASPRLDVHVSYDAGILSLTVATPEGTPQCSSVLVEAGNENTVLVELWEGKAHVPIPALPDALVIRLYP